MTRLLHQLGHRYQWSIDSLAQDSTGDGCICAPRYMARTLVQKLPAALRAQSLFDPQFFLPNSSRGKLATYPFFPQVVAGGFSTTEWTDQMALQCARDCLSFQESCEFSAVVVPTRFREGMPTSFIEEQDRMFVVPFLQAADEAQVRRSKLLQLIVTDFMLKDAAYRTDLLNWATRYSEFAGVYLIYHVHDRNKQITDTDFLMGLMGFVAALKEAGLLVMVGYANTEGALLACAGADVITMGSYENLRMFSHDAFDEPSERPIRGPNARVYVPRLLQWVEYGYLGAIRRVVGDFDSYIEDSQYRVSMFRPDYNWHFTKPEPYKHFFTVYSRQLRRLFAAPSGDLCAAFLEECQSALSEHDALRQSGVYLDPDSSGQHLNSWISVLNLWMRGAR
jgi:hypothetical protein